MNATSLARDAVAQFRDAMAAQGIVVADEIIADGRLHRYHVDGDKKGQRNAWAILHIDDNRPAGAFGCNRRYGTDQKFTWSAKGAKPLTQAERRALNERIERQKAERAAAERARHTAAAERAQQVWDAATDCTEHPYLTRKQIQSHGLRVGKWEKIDEETGDVRLISNHALLIPIRDAKKQVHSLQAIFPSKLMGGRDKDYLTGGNKAGHFYSIGKPIEFEGRIVIIICEGYATGASLHEATGHAVIVAFDAPNLLPVAQVIRARFPDAIIIMAADNDQWTLKPVNNPGVTRAREAAVAIGGLVAVPPFKHSEGTQDAEGKWSGPTDFNDMAQLRGPAAVRVVLDEELAETARVLPLWLVPTYDPAELDRIQFAADALTALDPALEARLSRRGVLIAEYGDAESLRAALDDARHFMPNANTCVFAAPGLEREIAAVAQAAGASVRLLKAGVSWADELWADFCAVTGSKALMRMAAQSDASLQDNGETAADTVARLNKHTGGKEDVGPARNGYFTILGYDRSDYFVYSHEKGQVLRRTKRDFDEGGLIEIAPLNWWEGKFSGDKPGTICRKKAQEFIFRAAHGRGIYDPTHVRGRGAWIDDGRVVYHHGSHLTVDGRQCDVTKIKSRFVYELARALPNLGDDVATDEEARWVVETAKKFRWERPASALLAAGFAALAPICGALEWRPHIWLTGGAGCGKSALLAQFIKPLVSGADGGEHGACVPAQGNSSEAGIRQRLKADALPVLFDEAESNEERDTARIQNVLSLIRQSSTESNFETLKGTAGGDGMSFLIRSMFALASIQTAIKQQADVERLTVLRLRDKRDVKAGDIEWPAFEAELSSAFDGGALPRRLINRSLRLAQTTRRNIRTFVAVAARRFGSQREGDQYGTLLAGAWSLLSSELATADDAATLIDSLDWSEHVEQGDDDRFDALHTMLACVVRTESGDATILELLQRAKGEHIDGLSMGNLEAERVLGRYGISFGSERLYVSNKSVVRDALMEKTKFHADLKGQLLRVPGAERVGSAMHFPGLGTSRCICIPLGSVLPVNDNRF